MQTPPFPCCTEGSRHSGQSAGRTAWWTFVPVALHSLSVGMTVLLVWVQKVCEDARQSEFYISAVDRSCLGKTASRRRDRQAHGTLSPTKVRNSLGHGRLSCKHCLKRRAVDAVLFTSHLPAPQGISMTPV